MDQPASTPQPRSPVTLEPWPADALALVPMRNLVLFPHALTPVSLGRQSSLRALQQALHQAGLSTEGRPVAAGSIPQGLRLGFVLQKDAQADDPKPEELCAVGTAVRLVRDLPIEEGAVGDDLPPRQLVCQGVSRFRVTQWLLTHPFLLARVEPVEDVQADEARQPALEAASLRLRERAGELLEMLPGVPAELVHAVQSTRSPQQLGHVMAGLIEAETAEKQGWLEMTDTAARLEQILKRVEHRITVLQLSQEIGLRTREHLQDRERRALLREQMQAIRRELGEDEASSRDTAALSKALEAAALPEGVKSEVDRELHRLESLPEAAAEHAMLRGWLQWVSELPWRLPERPSPAVREVLQHARVVLDADHAGLEKIKQSLLEHLAVQQLRPGGPAPILCFVGPPGVGKTSLGQSIARALDRPFGRLSLGGVHDEAEIRGHRRTYIGAMPGLILQTLRRCGARDAVLMLDEIDKLGSSVRGDPTAAMLEVLDPAQHHTFSDHYLGLPFDLSAVMFIATANVLEAIPAPLRDRMDVVELSGYTTEEKLVIAQRHLLPRVRQASGLSETDLPLDEQTLLAVIEGHTREAGVRQLERQLARLMRHAAWQLASGAELTQRWDAAALQSVLGPARPEREEALRRSLTGVATGLAWTPAGGDVLFVEATRVPGSGRLLLTGQLGDVMRESAQAALTLVKAQATALGADPQAFEALDVHVHVPAGAIPKDGPSAGVALYAALASLFSSRAVDRDVAMTGEISLRGLVLPVGGIREKVLAAARAGLRTVLLPVGNRRDWADVPASARERIEPRWIETVDELLRQALVPASVAEAGLQAKAGRTLSP